MTPLSSSTTSTTVTSTTPSSLVNPTGGNVAAAARVTVPSSSAAAAAVPPPPTRPPRKRRPKPKPPVSDTTAAAVAATTAPPTASPSSSSINDGTPNEGIPNDRDKQTRPTPPPPPPPPLLLPSEVPHDNEPHHHNNNTYCWWRDQVPTDSVDPITLEPLVSLSHPPFALVVSPPYTAIDWPPDFFDHHQSSSSGGEGGGGGGGVPNPTNKNHEKDDDDKEEEEERQRQILQAQWGKSLRISTTATATATTMDPPETDTSTTTKPLSSSPSPSSPLVVHQDPTPRPHRQRHVNLFDGRALAYYMVSQLQFIDPLNRRDITRDELIHLDRYLRRHDFDELNVVEAYDTKGVTVSSAGAVANTARGRTMILQQEAQALLNALFGGNSVSRSRPASTTTTTTAANHHRNAVRGSNSNSNSSSNNHNHNTATTTLLEQYEAHNEATTRWRPASVPSSGTTAGTASRPQHRPNTTNVLTDSGMIIIDDDETPGLRGNAASSRLLHPPRYDDAHPITARYAAGGGNVGPPPAYEFPALSATLPPSSRRSVPDESVPPKTLPKAKTLSKISKMVKETKPEEQQRQWEAREEARRKAMLANLTFGSNPMVLTSSEAQPRLVSDDNGGVPSQITTMNGPSMAQLERNRALAEALGVQPAPIRSHPVGGWSRPTERTNGGGLSEMERMFLDEDYETFCADVLGLTCYPDKLIQQAKDMRPDVLFKLEKKWKLFLKDDRAASLPLYPMDRTHRALVHEYAVYWKLHTESFDPEPKRYVHCVKLPETRAPNQLLSEAMKHWLPYHRNSSNNNNNTGSHNTGTNGAFVSTATAVSSMDHSTNQTSGQCTTSSEQRFQRLREFPSDMPPPQRIPLSLQKRTLPLEVPINENTPTGSAAVVDLNAVHLQQRERQEQKLRKKQEKELRKQRALQSAFASDDEVSDSDSEWEEKVAVYHSSSSGDESH